MSTLPPPLLFLSYDLQLSSEISTHQAEHNKQFSPLFPDKVDKFYCKFDELAKLDCKLDELAKLRMSSMSWKSWTVSWMSWLSCTVSSMSWLS